MRLIDADKLIYSEYTDMFDEPIVFDTVTKKRVDSMPTIEAIPIEWIIKWVKNWKPYTNVKSDVFYMLEAWEKENDEGKAQRPDSVGFDGGHPRRRLHYRKFTLLCTTPI